MTGATGCSQNDTELDDAVIAQCLRTRQVHFLSHELTPEQKVDQRYDIAFDKAPTTFQKSCCDSALRYRLGNKHVAHAIFQTGLPAPLMAEHYTAMHPGIDHILAWFIRIATATERRKADPIIAAHQQLSLETHMDCPVRISSAGQISIGWDWR